MSAAEHLSPDQFFNGWGGHADIDDYREGLNFHPYYGGLDLPLNMQRRKQITVGPETRLAANQPTVNKTTVRHYLDNPTDNPVQLHHDPEDDEYRIVDGHHRAVAARLAGRPFEAVLMEKRSRR